MRFLTNIPIKRKLTWVILLTSAGGLIAATLALFAYQLITFRQTYVRDLKVLSEIIANQSTAALAFGDKKTALELVSALVAKPNIVSAVIQLNDNTEFAQFGANRDKFESTPKDGSQFEGGYLVLGRPIILNGETRGTLYLRADYQSAFDELVRAHLGILAAVLAGSILLTLVLSTRLGRVISDPILCLADTAKTVADQKDYSVRAEKVSDDELGYFTEAFNQMLAQIQAQDTALQTARHELEDQVIALKHEIAERERAERQLEIANRELLEASRRAGMAEVATGVLHNVGNVLNSVNVSSILLHDLVRKSEIATVGELAALFKEHENDLAYFLTKDTKGRQVARLTSALAEQLSKEKTTWLAELDSLRKNIDHIKNIVAMQQNYASTAGFVERIELDKLVDDALEINVAALARHGIEVVRHYDAIPPMLLDKHKVLQVLVNLIQNAKYALHDSNQPHKQLKVSITKEGDRAVHITVGDNGVGILPENLTRIFAHGFTTRKKGHGFGLHASALAAREMGGNLIAKSAGPSRGATFILQLPLLPKEKPS